MRKKIIYYTLVVVSIFGWIIITGSAWYGYNQLTGYISRAQEHPNWCVFACMETISRQSNMQCKYATDYGQRLKDLYPTLNCCNAPLWSDDPSIDPIEMYSNWNDNCFSGVLSSDFYNFVSYYYPTIGYIGNLRESLMANPFRNYPFFGITEYGHCILVVGYDPDLTADKHSASYIYYWDPDYNSSDCIVINSQGQITSINAWGYEI